MRALDYIGSVLLFAIIFALLQGCLNVQVKIETVSVNSSNVTQNVTNCVAMDINAKMDTRPHTMVTLGDSSSSSSTNKSGWFW
jgi:hypothetical protein